jgi:hypothetical protein
MDWLVLRDHGFSDESNVEALGFRHAYGHLLLVVPGISKIEGSHGETSVLGFLLGILAANFLLVSIGRFDFGPALLGSGGLGGSMGGCLGGNPLEGAVGVWVGAIIREGIVGWCLLLLIIISVSIALVEEILEGLARACRGGRDAAWVGEAVEEIRGQW